MNRLLPLVLFALVTVLLSGCQATREFMASPAAREFVNGLVQVGVSEAAGNLSPDQAVMVSSIAQSAVDGVTTGQWQWDWDKLIPLGISSIAGAGGLNWWRNKQRAARGEPVGSSPSAS